MTAVAPREIGISGKPQGPRADGDEVPAGGVHKDGVRAADGPELEGVHVVAPPDLSRGTPRRIAGQTGPGHLRPCRRVGVRASVDPELPVRPDLPHPPAGTLDHADGRAPRPRAFPHAARALAEGPRQPDPR